jgi:hypothetical protein
VTPTVTSTESNPSRFAVSALLVKTETLSETVIFEGVADDECQSSVPDHQDGFCSDANHKNWLDLPMLVRLDSLHLLTEWQFHNPLRLRSIVKDDDETAKWVSALVFSYLFVCLDS